MAIPGFSQQDFAHEGVSKVVYRKGTGPGVVVITEVPGIHPGVITFAETLAAAGFTVFMPELFGTTGKPVSNGYVLGTMLKLCVSREFRLLAAHESSPVTDWLTRAGAERARGARGAGGRGGRDVPNRELRAVAGGRAVADGPGAVAAGAAAADQQGSPVGAGGLAGRAGDDPAARRDRGLQVARAVFHGRRQGAAGALRGAQQELRGGFEAIEIDSGPGNKPGIPKTAHSVLTIDLVREAGHPTEQALQRVLGFLHERLDKKA